MPASSATTPPFQGSVFSYPGHKQISNTSEKSFTDLCLSQYLRPHLYFKYVTSNITQPNPTLCDEQKLIKEEQLVAETVGSWG